MLRRSLIVALGSNSLWSETQRRPAAGALCHPDMWPACVACTPTELQRRVSRGPAAFCVRGRRRSSEGTAPNQPPDSAANSVPIGGPSGFLTRARTPPSRPGPVARASLVPVIWLLSAGARFQACEDREGLSLRSRFAADWRCNPREMSSFTSQTFSPSS